MVVINKTGGAGAIGMTSGAKAKKDGYTITMITREIVSLPLLGLSAVTYNDYELIALVNFDPAIITVKSDSKYNTAQDLIEAAKAHPESIKFASTAQPNFYALTIEQNQNIKFNHIPFNGAGESIPAVLGGHADFTITGPGEIKSQLAAGTLKSLGILANERMEGFDQVPTLKEQGIDVTSGTWRGLAVPKGVSPEIVEKLQKSFGEAIQSDEFKSFMKQSGFKIEYLNGPEFKTFLADDNKVLSTVMGSVKK